MNDKFLKSLIYILISFALIIFFLIQPYNIYCRITKGCNPVIISSIFWHQKGQTELTINFSAKIPQNLKNIVEFYPQENSKKIINGKNVINFYLVKNLTDYEISIRAMYHISPIAADKYLEKIECLCFQKQILAPKQSVEMPINFVIDAAIEKDLEMQNLKTIEVSYEIKLQ